MPPPLTDAVCGVVCSSSGGTEEGDREAEANLPAAEPEERRGGGPSARRGPGLRRQGRHDRQQRGDRRARARPALVMRRRRRRGDTSIRVGRCSGDGPVARPSQRGAAAARIGALLGCACACVCAFFGV